MSGVGVSPAVIKSFNVCIWIGRIAEFPTTPGDLVFTDMSGMDLDSPLCDIEQIYDAYAARSRMLDREPLALGPVETPATNRQADPFDFNDSDLIDSEYDQPEFKDQDPDNPVNSVLTTFGNRCQAAGLNLLNQGNLATVSLRDHPMVMKANVLAWTNNNPRFANASSDRSHELWATIRLTPRPPPSMVHSLDLAVEGDDGTLYVGADNGRRGRKRMRTAYVNGVSPHDSTGNGQQ